MVLDFILIFSVLLSVATGCRKGFSQMILSCIVFLFSIAFVVGIYSYLDDAIINSKYVADIYDTISENIQQQVTIAEENIIENAPYLSVLGMKKGQENTTIKKMTDELTLKIVKVILSVPLLFLSYLVFRFAVFILRKIIRKTTSLPVIHSIDSFLGSICGLLTGIIISGLIYFFVSYIQILPEFEFLKEQFSDSLIVMLINDLIF